MWGWRYRLRLDVRALWWPRPVQRSAHRVAIRRYAAVTADPPPLHWTPCHPSSVRRFKASITCPNGHGLTLRGHSVASNGDVSPSVVCPDRNCDFHAFIRLKRWTFGAVP